MFRLAKLSDILINLSAALFDWLKHIGVHGIFYFQFLCYIFSDLAARLNASEDFVGVLKKESEGNLERNVFVCAKQKQRRVFNEFIIIIFSQIYILLKEIKGTLRSLNFFKQFS